MVDAHLLPKLRMPPRRLEDPESKRMDPGVRGTP